MYGHFTLAISQTAKRGQKCYTEMVAVFAFMEGSR